MALLSRIKSVLTEPTVFFHHLKKEQGIKHAFWYLAIVALFGTVLSYFMLLLFPPAVPDFLSILRGDELIENAEPRTLQQLTPQQLLLNSLIGYLFFTLLGSFVFAGVLHLWIWLFGGSGSYAKTYQLYVYTWTPSYLIGWIPLTFLVLPITIIWSMVLNVIGAQQTHGLTKRRAVWAMVVVPLIIAFLFIAFVLFLGVAAYLAVSKGLATS